MSMSIALISSIALFATIVVSGLAPLLLNWKERHFDLFISFGAGVLLSAGFLHMLPESIASIGGKCGYFVLVGFLLLFLAEQVTMTHACAEEACPNHQVGLSAFFGLSIHSIIMGLALGVSFHESKDQHVAIAMLIAVLVHKVPETLALAGLLLASAWSKPKAFVAILVFALMGPLGLLLSSSYSGNILGAAMGISTGTFIYIAASDLLPHIHKHEEHRWWNLGAFLVGLLLLSFEIF